MEPTLRRSDLNSTSTRYDTLVAAPSDDMMQLCWIIWAVTSGIVSVACNLLIIAIVRSKRVRERTFNLYILYLTIPDSIFSTLCFFTCVSSAVYGKYRSNFHCKFQAFYCVFGWTANMWMNVAIAQKLLSLLRAIKKGRRFIKPRQTEVYTRVIAVYLYSAFVSCWILISWLPHRAVLIMGTACLPGEYDRSSTLFFWLVYIPAVMGIPLAYVIITVIYIFRSNLLPSHGNGRYLAVFFTRLLVVFVLMWLPSIIMIYVFGAQSIWGSIIGGAWSHLQGLVSAFLCLRKPDIRQSCWHFITCQKTKSDSFDDENTGPSSRFSSSSAITRRISVARRTSFNNISLPPLHENSSVYDKTSNRESTSECSGSSNLSGLALGSETGRSSTKNLSTSVDGKDVALEESLQKIQRKQIGGPEEGDLEKF